MAIIDDVKKLACYISNKYQAEYQSDISPLKLQKSLYFLFAYWGGYISKAKDTTNQIEVDYSHYNKYLFNEDIEAWVYGPVVPDVYREKGNLQIYSVQNFLENNKFVKEFIDDLLNQIFKISDFRLVDISHNDKVWKKYFNQQDENHNAVMPKDEIIAEYVNKF